MGQTEPIDKNFVLSGKEFFIGTKALVVRYFDDGAKALCLSNGGYIANIEKITEEAIHVFFVRIIQVQTEVIPFSLMTRSMNIPAFNNLENNKIA